MTEASESFFQKIQRITARAIEAKEKEQQELLQLEFLKVMQNIERIAIKGTRSCFLRNCSIHWSWMPNYAERLHSMGFSVTKKRVCSEDGDDLALCDSECHIEDDYLVEW